MKQGYKLLIADLTVVALAVALALITPWGHGSVAANGSVHYVDADAMGANNGSSWADAFIELQPALDAAVSGDQIWVATGTYKPTHEFIEGDPRSASFQMKNSVAIYGGFGGGEGSLDERDWVSNVTVLSGDIGIEGDNSDNVYHVLYHPDGTNLDSTATLSGFTISDGRASYPHYNGGGMYNEGSSPTLTHCTFVDNSAMGNGGGIYNSNSSPTLTHCTFENNEADTGAGMASFGESSPTLTHCAFTGNSAYSGGGMANGGSPTLINCTFSDNQAAQGGGISNSGSPALINCTFSGNSANSGGGMYNGDSSPTLTNCIFWGNTQDQIAGDAATVTYSDVEGGYEGGGNIDADPIFVDAANGDYHLGPGSPCIDVGNNDAPNLPEYDFEGDARVLDGNGDGTFVVDMGVDEVVYSGPPVLEVEIDIRPGSEQNPINLGSGGVVPVAILTTDEFDASTVRPASVLFAGAATRRWAMEDVDRDGDPDLLLNFRIRELELDQSSTEATLTGETFPRAGGVLIEGADSVRIVP